MTDKRRTARRREDRVWKKSFSVGYVILTLSIAAGLYTLENRDIERTETAALAGCERVNTLRESLNSISLVAYRAFYTAAQREKGLIKTDPQNAKTHRDSYKNLAIATSNLKFQGYTNCRQAVKHPKSYVMPRPRPYTSHDLK